MQQALSEELILIRRDHYSGLLDLIRKQHYALISALSPQAEHHLDTLLERWKLLNHSLDIAYKELGAKIKEYSVKAEATGNLTVEMESLTESNRSLKLQLEQSLKENTNIRSELNRQANDSAQFREHLKKIKEQFKKTRNQDLETMEDLKLKLTKCKNQKKILEQEVKAKELKILQLKAEQKDPISSELDQELADLESMMQTDE